MQQREEAAEEKYHQLGCRHDDAFYEEDERSKKRHKSTHGSAPATPLAWTVHPWTVPLDTMPILMVRALGTRLAWTVVDTMPMRMVRALGTPLAWTVVDTIPIRGERMLIKADSYSIVSSSG